MEYVPGFDIDVFVSYCTHFFPPKTEGRAVNDNLVALVEILKEKLQQISNADRWWKPQLALDHYRTDRERDPSGIDWKEDVTALLTKSALFLALDCDSWRLSGACQWEVREFIKLREQDGPIVRLLSARVYPPTASHASYALPEAETAHLVTERVFSFSNFKPLYIKDEKNQDMFLPSSRQDEFVKLISDFARNIVGCLNALRELRVPPRDNTITNESFIRRSQLGPENKIWIPHPTEQWADLRDALVTKLERDSTGQKDLQFFPVDSLLDASHVIQFVPENGMHDRDWREFGRIVQVADKSNLEVYLVSQSSISNQPKARFTTRCAMIDSVESSRRKGKSNYKIITLENADANDASINAILGRLVADRASPTRASFGAKVEMRSGVLILYSRDMWEQDLARRLQSELSSTLSNVDVRCVLYKTITNQESIADPARDVICLVGSHFYGDPFDPDLDRLRDRLQQLGAGKRLFPVLASDKSFVEPRWLAVPSSEILDYTARSQQEIESQLPADIAKRFTKQRAMAV